MEYIDGIGVHWYGNSMTAPSLFRYINKCNPDKFIMATEACCGFRANDVILGSWDRAMEYISDIITDLSYNLVGWIDWNLCLDEQGGPNWAGNFVDAPIIVLNNQKEFVKQPMFYAMGHFSKWIPRGCYRINIKVKQTPGLEQIAFRTPDENIVVVLHNKNSAAITVTIVLGELQATVTLKAYSVTTIEFPFQYKTFGVRRGILRPASKLRNLYKA